MTKKHDIIWLESVDSTNDEARRRISNLDNLSVLSAVSQTKGRGQRGNTWLSKGGENLTFSIVLKYSDAYSSGKDGFSPVRAIDQFVISEITALSIVDLLAGYDIEAKIKWPNDIYVKSKKICGILIEHAIRAQNLSYSISGIGLNVNQTEFDPDLPNPTSMALCLPERNEDMEKPFKTAQILEEYMDIFTSYCRRYLNITGGYSRLRKLYLAQMWRMDESARYIDIASGKEFTGKIRGLSDIGLLAVEDMEKGELREFAFKEIGYIL